MINREKVLRKLKKTYIKVLRHYALRHTEKAQKLEQKAILLELRLMDQRRLIDEIDEGLDALAEKNT